MGSKRKEYSFGEEAPKPAPIEQKFFKKSEQFATSFAEASQIADTLFEPFKEERVDALSRTAKSAKVRIRRRESKEGLSFRVVFYRTAEVKKEEKEKEKAKEKKPAVKKKRKQREKK